MKLSLYLSLTSTVIIIFSCVHVNEANAYTYNYCDLKTQYIHSPEQIAKINYWTDYFFFLFRPELKKQSMIFSHKLYQRERAGIRGVVRRVILCGGYWERKNYYIEKIYLEREPHQHYWLIRNNYLFDGFYAELTDAVFYAHHPELPKKKSNFKNLNWSTEWINIRQSFASYQQENNLFAHFIPIYQPVLKNERVITLEQLRELTNNRFRDDSQSDWRK